MAKKKTKKVFVLHSGDRYDVTGETGKYWICGNTQFRKLGNMGEIETVKTEPETKGE